MGPTGGDAGLEVRKIAWNTGCINLATGAKLDCEMWFETRFAPPSDPGSALFYTGGHLHPLPNGNDPTRPIGLLCTTMIDQDGPACPSSNLEGENPRSFHGFTRNALWPVTRTMPKFGGVLEISARYRFVTTGIYCVPDWLWSCDPDGRGGYTTFYFLARVRDLGELPPDPAYIRCGKADGCLTDNVVWPEHPMPFFGTAEMVSAAQQLAQAFSADNGGSRLRILDLSLPLGGLMEDLTGSGTAPDYAPWSTPHTWHRHGIDVDVDKQALGPDGQLATFNQDLLDRSACTFSLNRYEYPYAIHYRNEPCAKRTPGR